MTGPPGPAGLPGLLRASAARVPDRIAVRDGRTALRYRDLVAAVDGLAARLVGHGAGPGVWVAQCLPRGVPAVVAQAAVLAVGAVHVPVARDLPPDRLAAMLGHLDGVLVVGDADGLAACGRATTITPVPFGPDGTGPATTPPPGSAPGPGPDDDAYVIHTSGSTGVPKGVLVGHAAITASTLARRTVYPEPVDGFLLVSPLTFDSSMAGLWWTLDRGGVLETAPPDPGDALARLRRALTDDDAGISHTLLTPTLYARVLDRLDGRPSAALRRVVVAGESCPESLVERHHAVLPGVALTNEYGPTETAVWCAGGDLRPGEPVTVGRAVPGVELTVRDPDGRPVPDGTRGEIWVAGPQLARGYPRDPELTAARFPAHPERPGERGYRTGDLGHRDPDGRFVVAGRTDEQVQIRGRRVDLAGVRARLGRCPGVADLALAPRRASGHAGDVLTAYVVARPVAAGTDAELRATWARVVDERARTAAARGTAFDTSGWDSSYTGAPLPDADMTEWIEATCALLREGAPSSVLDLGCGSGLPLLRIAPDCDRYVALDVSTATLDGVRAAVDDAGLTRVTLRRGEATDAAEHAGQAFDLVVANSVSQYFPDLDYLDRTVRHALAATGAGGRVVIGDVRDLALRDAFHTSIALARSPGDASAADVAAHRDELAGRDGQLLVSPAWFAGPAVALPGVHVRVRPRRGVRRNEMTDFRYDVVLYGTGDVDTVDVPRWWASDELRDGPERTLPDALRALLRGTAPVGVTRVPNARAAGAARAAGLLRDGWTGTAGELAEHAAAAERAAVDPETLIALAAELGWTAHLERGRAHPHGELDAVFLPPGYGGTGRPVLPRFAAPEPPAEAASDPVGHRALALARSTLVPELRAYAERTLEPAERPGAYVVLPALPTDRNGKLDTAALPDPPAPARTGSAGAPPTTATEVAVAAVWADALGVGRIGVDDDFVRLGGDSLLAAACAVRVSERFGVTLPSGVLFSAPTVRAFARVVDRAQRHTPRSVPAGNGARLPLGPAQTVFWYLDHYRRPGGSRHPDFALPVHYRIRGPLDVRALSTAVDTLVARHESLRTALALEASEGTQTVLPPRTGVLSVVRYAGAAGSDAPHAALDAAARDDAADPLDTATGRVFTARLTSVSDHEHLLVLRVHHMVADGWSMDVLEDELGELYAAARDGRPAELAPAPSHHDHVRYTDHTFFADLDWRDQEPYRSALDYWRAQAAGMPGHPADDSDEPHAPTRQCSVDLPAAVLEPVLDRARSAGATLFSTVAAAFAQARPGIGDEVALLTLNAARDAPELERMVGLLLNPVLLRLPTAPDTRLAALLPETGRRVRAAFAHAQVPLLALCEEVPELLTALAESELVGIEVLPPARGIRLDDCLVRRSDPFDDDFPGRRFQLPVGLLIVVRRTGDTVRITALHDPSVLDDAPARQLLDTMRTLLTSGVATTDEEVS